MNAKQQTFKVLDKLKDGTKFTGYQLMNTMNRLLGEVHYPDTYMRYAREYRSTQGRSIVNIDKKKSIYLID